MEEEINENIRRNIVEIIGKIEKVEKRIEKRE